MKNVFGLKKTVLASVIAASMVAPSMAAAEVSGSLGISNMYFWRGQDISAGGAQVFGSLDYAHETGLYAGIWGSSETDTTEYDLYAGYGGEIEGFSYDISYIDYNYPNDTDSDLEEIILSLGFAGVTATGYFGVGETGADEDYEDNYFTLGYGYDKYGILVGTWDVDADDANYTHVDLSYALTDQLSFTVSKIVYAEENSAVYKNEDALFVVSYSFAI